MIFLEGGSLQKEAAAVEAAEDVLLHGGRFGAELTELILFFLFCSHYSKPELEIQALHL